MKRVDNYPTRKANAGKFIKRKEIVAYDRSMFLSHNQYQFYCTNGYLIVRDFFSLPETISALAISEQVNGFVTNEPTGKGLRAKTGIHESFPEIYKNEKLLSIAKAIVGSDVYVHQSRINYKHPFNSTGWSWHSDFETWHAQDGMPSMRCVSAMVPLTSNTECNGSLMLIPKSHKLFWSAPKTEQVSAEENFADQKEGVPDEKALRRFFANSEIVMALMQPGDLLLFDCNTIHVSNPNLSPVPRTNLFFVYNSIENKLQKPFSTSKHRPESMGTTKIKEVL